MLDVKNAFGPLCNTDLRLSVADTSLLKDKMPAFKRVFVFMQFYSFCYFHSVIESEFIAFLCSYHIFVFHFVLTYI